MQSSGTDSVQAAKTYRSQPAGSQTTGEGTDPDVEQGPDGSDRTPEGQGAEEPLLRGGQPQPRGPIARLKAAAKRLKRRMRVLYYASIDPQLPWTSKLLANLAVAYALSPIDLIPDFIPILGMLDDLIILPGLIWLAVRFIPPPVMERAEYAADHFPIRLQDNWRAALVVLLMVAKAHAIRWPITVQSASAVLLLQLWDLLALLVVYYACTRWGGPWLRDNWPAVAGPVAGALFVAETIWAAGEMRKHEREAAAQRASVIAAAQELLQPQERQQQEPGGAACLP